MRYDLHTHSTCSDGTTTPTELAEEAHAIGLAGFSLTDHDTTEGWDEAREAARTRGLDFLPGMELTTTHGWRSAHLLAYGFDVANAELQGRLEMLREARRERAHEMVRRLRADFDADWDALLDGDSAAGAAAATASLGRPHLADLLVAGGYFRDRSHAFETALSPGGPYYVPTETLSTSEAIELVIAAGGVPVLAHPAAQRMRSPFAVEELAPLANLGLAGVETEHPENRPEWIAPLRDEAVRLGLLTTGASDYHGAGKPNRLGQCTSPIETVERIRAAAHTPA